MNYIKPQKPLIQDGKGIYPITTIDQVVRADGRRFSEYEFNRVFQRNLLRPTLPTTTTNGVTCTNNGDGTFTLNGTASDTCRFKLNTIELSKGSYKVIGTPKGGNNDYSIGITGNLYEYGDGLIISLENDNSYDFYIVVMSGKTVSNILFKPMLTEDLNATYDDFVSFDDSVITGINSGIKMDLLWTNANPASAFASQTISLDLSKYNLVYIIFANNTVSYPYGLFYKGYKTSYLSHYEAVSNMNMNQFHARNVEVQENGVIFGNNFTDTGQYNTGNIPIKIYGVK